MRTTIEIPDEQRAKLLEAAARRGEKGFSSIVCCEGGTFLAGTFLAGRKQVDLEAGIRGSSFPTNCPAPA